jgi:hypothetical protein
MWDKRGLCPCHDAFTGETTANVGQPFGCRSKTDGACDENEEVGMPIFLDRINKMDRVIWYLGTGSGLG